MMRATSPNAAITLDSPPGTQFRAPQPAPWSWTDWGWGNIWVKRGHVRENIRQGGTMTGLPSPCYPPGLCGVDDGHLPTA
jgi:hypothetical protein